MQEMIGAQLSPLQLANGRTGRDIPFPLNQEREKSVPKSLPEQNEGNFSLVSASFAICNAINGIGAIIGDQKRTVR